MSKKAYEKPDVQSVSRKSILELIGPAQGCTSRPRGPFPDCKDDD